jgi:hypothetical protein
MKQIKKGISVLLVCFFVAESVFAAALGGVRSHPTMAAAQPAVVAYNPAGAVEAVPSLDRVIALSPWEVAELAERFSFDPQAIKVKAEELKKELKRREESFKSESKVAEKRIEAKENERRKVRQDVKDPATLNERKRIQCEIAGIKKDLTERALAFLQAQNTTDVHIAKLNLLSNWRSASSEIDRKIADGSIDQRRFGNVLDSGHRSTQKPFRGQADDVKWGEKEIETARQQDMLPKAIDDPVVTEYVNPLAQNIARNGDLQVPPRVFVVHQELRKNGKVVLDQQGQPQQVANAMALPGWYLFVYAGMILASGTESELAGVVAHEISHAAARHAHRMASKGTWYNIAQLGAVIGLQIFAPGLFTAASYLGYQLKMLLLQGIFSGMGLIFTIDALGVSRDFELEADQLGMQYAWKSGYDPVDSLISSTG